MFANYNLGVLGGGQLGRMLVQSAIDFNLNIHVLDPNANAPCSQLVANFTQGSLMDYDTVYNFGKNCDLITIEIEAVNTDALLKLEQEGKKVFPQPSVIKLIQDKRAQKQFYDKHNIPTAPFYLLEEKESLEKYKSFLPFVQKLGVGGYDGRGVEVMRTEADFSKAFDAPSLVEKMVEIDKELSVIVARNEEGHIVVYPTVELVFDPDANLVDYLLSPAQVSDVLKEEVTSIATRIIEKLDMVGILAVEFFLSKDGKILVNEMAPRTHNSGHHTIESNVTSQFEQHLRAILNFPLGDTSIRIPAAMVNLLGERNKVGQPVYQGYRDVLGISGTHLHLYGKNTTKPMRKMGHITITDSSMEQLIEKVKFIKKTIKVTT
jgi:5-(carboxyamino)imidazole ribonucleotide synthase